MAITLTSCFTDDEVPIAFDEEESLMTFLEQRTFIEYEVIACAASDNKIVNDINVYFYPEEGSSNYRLYHSSSNNAKDYSSYTLIPEQSEGFFQGALRVFKVRSRSKWFVVTFEKNGKVEVSSPIRSKVFSQPTQWSETLTINYAEPLMPVFSWEVDSEENNAIFFQVVSTENLQLLSGTYTEENQFQYYNLSNVVLNITEQAPPNLVKGTSYIFTLMDVSEDNWVNLIITKPFEAQ